MKQSVWGNVKRGDFVLMDDCLVAVRSCSHQEHTSPLYRYLYNKGNKSARFANKNLEREVIYLTLNKAWLEWKGQWLTGSRRKVFNRKSTPVVILSPDEARRFRLMNDI